jgi:hypothetical protein
VADLYLAPCQDRTKGGYVPPPPPDIVTYRILTETGDVIATERADKLRMEQSTP